MVKISKRTWLAMLIAITLISGLVPAEIFAVEGLGATEAETKSSDLPHSASTDTSLAMAEEEIAQVAQGEGEITTQTHNEYGETEDVDAETELPRSAPANTSLAMTAEGVISPRGAEDRLQITPMKTGTVTPIDISQWDYVTDYTYYLQLNVTPGAPGENRTILMTAPQGFRYVIPASLPGGITDMTYQETEDDQGKNVLITIADSLETNTATTSLTVLRAGAATTVTRDNALISMGTMIQAAGTHPSHIHTAVYKDNGITTETDTVNITLKTYKDSNIFNWFRYTFNYGAPNNKNFETLSMDAYGVIGAKGPNAAVSEWDHLYYLDNTETHEPYWNLQVKIYLPQGITSNNTNLDIMNDNDGKGDYVVLDSSLTLMSGSAKIGVYDTAKMLSPLADAASQNAAASALGVKLMLALKEGQAVESGKTYTGSPIELSYTTASGNHVESLAPLKIKTETFTDTDNYAISLNNSLTPFDFPQGFNGSSAASSKLIKISTPYGSNPTVLNNKHIGGTLTFEMGANYEVYGITAAWLNQNNNRYLPRKTHVFPVDAVATYYIGGTAYTDATRQGDVFNFPSATEGNHVDKVVFTFPTGFELPETQYSFGLNLRTGTNLPDNVAGTSGLHRSSLKVTLADDSCAAFNGIGNPQIKNGAHTQTFNVDMRVLKDVLLMQTYGNSPTMSLGQYPFLSGTTGTASASAAHLAFGYNTFNGTVYQNQSGAWMSYHGVKIDLSGDETLSMLNGEIKMPASILYTNLRFDYTTNHNPGIRSTDPVSNGNPSEGATGSARTINLGLSLSDGEYITSLTLRADAFKVVAVHYFTQNGISFWGRDGNAGRISFQSRTDRTLPGSGEAVPDYTVAEGYSFDARMTSSDIGTSTKASTMATSTNNTYGVQNVKFALNQSASLYAGAGYTRPVEVSAGSVPQGDAFNISVTRGSTGSNLRLLNSEIWLRINPHFSLVDLLSPADTAYEIKEYEGQTWVLIKEDPNQNHTGTSASNSVSYTLRVRALPSTPVGSYDVIDKGFINLTDTVDSVKQGALAPYLYGTLAPGNNGQNFVDSKANHEGKDFNGNDIDDSEELLVNMLTAKTNISPKLMTGLEIMPGIGMSYAGADSDSDKHYKVSFYEKDSKHLSLYSALGGSPSQPLSNYEVILNIPNEGANDTVSYFDGNTVKTITPEFAMALTGAASLDVTGLNETIEYSTERTGDSWASQEDAADWTSEDWSLVKRVRIFVPTMPKGITAGVKLSLTVEDFNDDAEQDEESYIAGFYSYGDDAASEVSGYSNLAVFKANLYTLIGGFVFQDHNNDNVFDAGDVKWAGVTVRLLDTDENGISTVAKETTTDADGVYHFEGLYAGNYAIKVVKPQSSYDYADAGAGSDTSTQSHVDTDGVGLVFELMDSMTLGQNAGLQARHALTVEYRAEGASEPIQSTGKIPQANAEPAGSATASFNETGYHLEGEVTKDYVTSFLSPEAVVVFPVAPNSFTVNFDSQSADIPASFASKTITYPSEVVGALPSAPQKTGSTFEGWFTEPGGLGSEYTSSTAVSTADEHGGNVIVFAKWTLNPVTPVPNDPIPVDPPENPIDPIEEEGGSTPTLDEPVAPLVTTPSTEEPDREIENYDIDENSSNGEVLQALKDQGVQTMTIGEVEIPLSAGKHSTLVWALVNLIFAITGILLALIATLRARRKKRDTKKGYERSETSEEQRNEKKRVQRRNISLGIAAIFAICSIVLFVITEDITRLMVLTDDWTPVNAVILIAEIAFVWIAFWRTNGVNKNSTRS